MEKPQDQLLDRDHLPDNVEVLKDLFIEVTQELRDKIQGFTESIEYLQSQLSIMRRFQYGQRSERLKKKR